MCGAACRWLMPTAVLLPGFFARAMSATGIITQAQPCPVNYFCPGAAPISTFDPSNPLSLSPSEPSIKSCAGGMSTREVGSTAADQCCEWRRLNRESDLCLDFV
jgi:hypothetical protein